MNIDEPNGARAPGALHRHSRRIAFSVVIGQVVAGLTVALILAVGWNARAGYSALAGAAIGILPTYYLAVRMFRRAAPLSADQALRGIYLGEAIKVVFTIALFVMAMRLLDVDLLTLAVGYVATVVVNWVAVARADLGETPTAGVRGAGITGLDSSGHNQSKRQDHGSRLSG